MLNQIKNAINKLKNPAKQGDYQRFFKTGKGQYGEGDKFLGLTMGQQHKIAQKYFKDASLDDVQALLNSKIHEYRMVALQILVRKYQKANEPEKIKIVNLYLKNYNNINNWDLVDVTAPKILGPHFLNRDKNKLYEFARSNNLWKKRISILTTAAFIRDNQFTDTFRIAEILLKDDHDLIHKAVGWMLREVGNMDMAAEERFLKKHYKKMPRTMLRYAIEKFPEKRRKAYLNGTI